MSSPTREQIEKIVEAAQTAPSGDNCQPWRFEYDGKALSIFHIDERGHHVLNPKNYASYITLGGVLACAEIAAKNFGFSATTKVSETFDEASPWATMTFTPDNSPDAGAKVLYSSLFGRHVNRNPYRGSRGDSNAKVDSTIERLNRSYPEIRVQLITSKWSDFLKVTSKVEGSLWKDQRIHKDLFRWFRFKKHNNELDYDGMPWRTLGVSIVEATMIRCFRNFTVQNIANFLGFTTVIRLITLRNILSSSRLVLFTAKSSTPNTLIDVGRVALQVWVELNASGWGVQPVSSVSLGVFYAKVLPEMLDDPLFQSFATASDPLKQLSGHAVDETPVWMFRTGPAKPLGLESRAARLPVNAVLKHI